MRSVAATAAVAPTGIKAATAAPSVSAVMPVSLTRMVTFSRGQSDYVNHKGQRTEDKHDLRERNIQQNQFSVRKAMRTAS